MKTNKDYTVEFENLGEVTVPAGTELTHMTASGPDLKYHFVKNLDWYESKLGNEKDTFAFRMEIWDLEHRGIDIPKDYVDYEGNPDLLSSDHVEGFKIHKVDKISNDKYIYAWDSDLKCWVKQEAIDQRRVVEIKFEGIDDWNRPVFVEIKNGRKGRNRFGDVNNLFGYDTDEFKEFLPKYIENPNYYLEYFGTSFGCEPHGGMNKNIKLKIID